MDHATRKPLVRGLSYGRRVEHHRGSCPGGGPSSSAGPARQFVSRRGDPRTPVADDDEETFRDVYARLAETKRFARLLQTAYEERDAECAGAVFAPVDDDEIPSVADFELLHDIDTFNAKIKQAITGLHKHPRELVRVLLRAHEDDMAPASTVNRLALQADELTGKKRRPELAQRMVAAGAMDARPDRLRKRLSEASAVRRGRDLVDDLEAPSTEEEATRQYLDDLQRTARVVLRLVGFGVMAWDVFQDVMDSIRHVREELQGDPPSEFKTDASAFKTDG